MGLRLSPILYQLLPGMIGFNCPGCKTKHFFYTDQYHLSGPKWQWNGDVNYPTVTPSMLMSTNIPRNEAEKANPVTYTQCHLFIKNGQIEYLPDCQHEYAGKTIPMIEHSLGQDDPILED